MDLRRRTHGAGERAAAVRRRDRGGHRHADRHGRLHVPRRHAASNWARGFPQWFDDVFERITDLGLDGPFLFPFGFILL
jgi:hypothetical protein